MTKRGVETRRRAEPARGQKRTGDPGAAAREAAGGPAGPAPFAPRTRREFMRLLAAGSAAALAAPFAANADQAQPAGGAKPANAPPTAGAKTAAGAGQRTALPEEIEKQKQYLADSLKKIRDYALPPGSAPAFTFRPLAGKRRPRGTR